MTAVEGLIGRFEGTGEWHDSAGKSSTYTIRQTNSIAPDGFEVLFTHDFADGSVVDARFRMTWVTAEIFRVAAGGVAVGHGYVFGDYCHYHLETGTAFVEASYRFSAGAIEVFGSSTKNAEGHYIAWKEELRRISAG